MYRGGGSGGDDDGSNGDGTCGDDGHADEAVHLARHSSAEGGNSKPGRVFWGANEELSDGGSLRVIVYGYNGLPMQPVAPPSPYYIHDPEEPQTPPTPQDEDEREPMFIQLHDPDYVPKPMYLEYIPLEDDHMLLAEEQPLPPIDSPTAESPGYALIDAVTATLPSPPLPPPLYIPPPVDCRDDIPETEMPPRKRLCLSTLGSGYEIRESSSAKPTEGQEIDYGFVSTLDVEARRRGIREVRYGIRDTWVDPVEEVPEIPHMTLEKDSRTRISQRVTMDSQRINLLIEDRIPHQETILIVEEKAYVAREA
nr:hypothetical protein [Tanacetum cinerariifolium]